MLNSTSLFAHILVSTSIHTLLLTTDLKAQGSTHHIPGKVYVIRLTPMETDSMDMERYFKREVAPALEKDMFDHVRANLHRMQEATDGRWFVGYFDPNRQDRDVLMRDNDLLVWLMHGQEVQIMPIETVRSPLQIPR